MLSTFFTHKHVRLGSIIFVILLGILLALKNPYDTQSLIPNLEPYPDTLFYSYPAMSFVREGTWSMRSDTVSPRIATSPGYSLLLVPIFALRQSVLDFFWLHIVLLILAALLIVYISRQLYPKQHMIQLFVLGVFVTHFYVYTMPSLLMAELVTIVAVLGATALMLTPQKFRPWVLISSSLLLPFLKVSNSALGVAYAVWHMIRQPSVFKKYVAIGFAGVMIVYMSGFLSGHKNLQPGSSLSLGYITENGIFYMKALLGSNTRYLWYQEKLISPLISLLGCAGLVWGARSSSPRIKHFSKGTIGVIVVHTLFMSAFVTPDARYVSSLIPLIILSSGIPFAYISGKAKSIAVIASTCAYLFIPLFSQTAIPEMHVLTLKKQIGLNFLHPEQPWNYIAIKEIEKHVQGNPDTKTYLGTFLPPHYVNLISDSLIPVPLTLDQEFYTPATTLPGSTKSIADMYEHLLTQGNVYVTNAYSSNLPSIWQPAFQDVLSEFAYNVVYEGCYASCTLYRLTSRVKGNASN